MILRDVAGLFCVSPSVRLSFFWNAETCKIFIVTDQISVSSPNFTHILPIRSKVKDIIGKYHNSNSFPQKEMGIILARISNKQSW